MQTVAGDGVAGIKRRRRDLSSDGVKNLATTSGRGRLKEDLESSTWEQRGTSSIRHHPVGANGYSFYRLQSEDPNQHLKDFLKLIDSLDIDGENRERTCMRLFQFSLRDQASNWLERRTAKLCNDILMFQQHHGESLSEAWTHFKNLLQKVPHHGIDRWLQIQIFYDHVSFLLKCEIDRAAGGKICNKNPDESWEIIKNLALYDHEGWNDAKEFAKPERTGPIPQPQALGTTFEARVRDYMAAHTERMERFKNAILKQREEINDKMAEMFGLLKELTTREEEKNNDNDIATSEDSEKPTRTETGRPINEAKNGIKNEPIRKAKK
ncbi:hypothetical protein Tco_0838631 [Tanacetum coccineum]|uniref:Zinc finger, CCHC-type n=1 Tax=Tanacetum coccineum TaxID=301880 RepID=A0ABQ5ASW2_9ASTR